jgi:hypothetical protein
MPGVDEDVKVIVEFTIDDSKGPPALVIRAERYPAR